MKKKTRAAMLTEHLGQYNCLCWYPSAGFDFRPLLYLSPAWAERHGWEEDRFPDCFIMTNACGDDIDDAFLGKEEPVLYRDARTRITASDVKEMPTLRLSHNPELAYDAFKMLDPLRPHDLYKHYGRILSMKVHVHSEQLGDWDTALVYCIAENTAFAMEYLLKRGPRIEYVWRAHYGYMLCRDSAGNRSTGHFLLRILRNLGARYFITDKDWESINTVDPAEVLYEEQLQRINTPALTEVASIAENRKKRYYEFGFGIYKTEHRDGQEPPVCPLEETSFIYVRVGAIWGPQASGPLSMHDCLVSMMEYACWLYKCRTYTEFIRLIPPDITSFPLYVRQGEERFMDIYPPDYEWENQLVLEDGSRLSFRRAWTYEDYLKLLAKLQTFGLVAVPDWSGRRALNPQ